MRRLQSNFGVDAKNGAAIVFEANEKMPNLGLRWVRIGMWIAW